MSARRIGILTAGGDCPGLNAVIRAVVRAAAQRDWDVLGIEDATHGLIDLDHHHPLGNQWLTLDDVEDILKRGGTILGTSNKSDPFHYVVDTNGSRVEMDVSDRVMANYRAFGLDAMVWVGGDGSMRIAQHMGEKGMNIVGVPKTIDLDLGGTDYSFGFSTAVDTITNAVDRLQDTAESHDRVMIVEVMGRNAGFLALHGALAGGAHICLLPEIPYRIERVLAKIRERCDQGHPYSIAIVAEGAAPAGSAPVYAPLELGAMPKLIGAAARLGVELQPHVDLDLRVTVLGHLQRGGTPNHFDRILATRFGVAAVEAIERGEYGCMVSLRTPDIVTVPIADAIAQPRRVDPDGSLVHAAKSVGIELGG